MHMYNNGGKLHFQIVSKLDDKRIQANDASKQPLPGASNGVCHVFRACIELVIII